MNLSDMENLLKTTGYPVAHIEFNKPPSVPYLVYLVTGEEHRGSDCENNIVECIVQIELYTEYKDKTAEKKLDELLSFTEFQKDKSKISDERLLMIVYEFETINKI